MEVKRGGGGGDSFSFLAYFSNSSCVCNSGFSNSNLFDLIHILNFYQVFLAKAAHSMSFFTNLSNTSIISSLTFSKFKYISLISLLKT